MSNRTFLVYAAILLAVIAGQVATLVYVGRHARAATVECRATNAGIPLGPADAEVFAYPAGQHARLAAQGKLEQALRVPPGRYDLRVLFTRSRDRQERWVQDVTVSERQRAVREVEFAAGELSVAAEVGAGDGEEGRVVLQVFRPGDTDEAIATAGAGERLLLGAGSYDLRVVLAVGPEAEEKDVAWLRQVAVRPGLHVEKRVVFERGILRVEARSARREIPPGSVALTVHRAGDVQREVVQRGWAGVPLGLPPGRYDVEATFTASHDRPSRWLRDVAIEDGQVRDETVEFSSGTLLVRARMPGGQPLDGYRVYLYLYREGDHREAIAYLPAGEAATLEAGRYDVRAHFFRSSDRPDLWLRGLAVEAGETTTETVTFPSGRLLVRAFDARGEELRGDDVFVHVFPGGQRRRPIVTARTGEELVLTAGVYDVRLEDTRRPGVEAWLPGVVVEAGRLAEESRTLAPEAGSRAAGP